jgi:hypothetical protein
VLPEIEGDRTFSPLYKATLPYIDIIREDLMATLWAINWKRSYET